MEPTHDDHKEFIFRSKLPDISIPTHLPLHTYLFENLSQFKDRPCLIDGNTGEIFTYVDVELTTRKVATGLNNIDIKQYDVILILLHSCPQFVLTFLGASYCGVGDYLNFSELITSDESNIPIMDISPDDIVVLPFSSGTTAGAAILIMQRFGIIKVLELVQKHKVTFAQFVPPILLAIVKNPKVERYDLSSIKMIMFGATPLEKELEEVVSARLPNIIFGQVV
ncbi:unnamed protein product [Lupinus luteus]|uniref:4-coumarate--CoA ligase n=1 Tax=Lupinus luteus TaxID=3873 RepID=A0AAV1Y966_LUPLU